MKKTSGMPSKFPESFRIKVAKDYLSSDLSLSEIAKKYDLKHREQVRWFVKWYKIQYGDQNPKAIKTISENDKKDIIQLKAQLKLKEQALSNAFLQIDSLNTLIRVAEKSLNISIGKKFGAK